MVLVELISCQGGLYFFYGSSKYIEWTSTCICIGLLACTVGVAPLALTR